MSKSYQAPTQVRPSKTPTGNPENPEKIAVYKWAFLTCTGCNTRLYSTLLEGGIRRQKCNNTGCPNFGKVFVEKAEVLEVPVVEYHTL